ncbi:hypothetical protein X801_05008, partial [Opisthorchis viverrini]
MSVLLMPSPPRASTSSGLSTQELMKQLDLAPTKIRKLGLEANAAKRINECQEGVQKEMEKLGEIARSMNFGILEPCSYHATNEQCDAVKRYFKRDPTFDELAKFIDDKANAAAAQQVYAVGRRFMRPQPNTVRPQPTHKSPLYKAAILTTQTDNDISGQCQEFVVMPVVSRIPCVDRLRVCYLFLKPDHQAKVCRSRHACGFQLCVGKHHSILHRPSSSMVEMNQKHLRLHQ